MIKRYLLISMGIYSLSFAYNVGDYVNMIDQEKEFDVCYGSTDDIVKLSDYNGDLNGGMYHVIHIDMADGEVVASSDTINNLAKFLKTEVETKENKNGDKEFIFPEYNRWELYDSIRGMSAELRSKTNEELDQMPSQEILTTLAVPGLTRETNKARKIRNAVAKKEIVMEKALDGGTIGVMQERDLIFGWNKVENSLMRIIPSGVEENKANGRMHEWFGLMMTLPKPVFVGDNIVGRDKKENPYNRKDSSLLSPGDVLVINKNEALVDLKKGEEDIDKAERVVVVTDSMEIHFGKARQATPDEVEDGFDCKDFITVDRNEAKTELAPHTYLVNDKVKMEQRGIDYEWQEAALAETDTDVMPPTATYSEFDMAVCYKVLLRIKNPYGEIEIPF